MSACNCIGPQGGQPRCPCMMRGVIQRDGRWIEPERDLGPVRSTEESGWGVATTAIEGGTDWSKTSGPRAP